jgi:hypothetical protein
MTALVTGTDLAPLLTDDREGARVALVDLARDPLSETLTATARRVGPDAYVIVQPRTFTFARLQLGVLNGLAVYVGDWRGLMPLPPLVLGPGDTYHLHLPGELA